MSLSLAVVSDRTETQDLLIETKALLFGAMADVAGFQHMISTSKVTG